MKKDKIGKSISIKQANRIAVKSLLQAEQRRQNEREREAKYYCPEHKYNPPKNSGLCFCPYCEAKVNLIDVWIRNAPGYYTNRKLGSIRRYSANEWWYFERNTVFARGGYKTLLAAQQAAADLAK